MPCDKARAASKGLVGSLASAAPYPLTARSAAPSVSAARACAYGVRKAKFERFAWPAAGTASSATAEALSVILHVRIIGPSSAFGYHPVDVLGRILDVARLAMDAI